MSKKKPERGDLYYIANGTVKRIVCLLEEKPDKYWSTLRWDEPEYGEGTHNPVPSHYICNVRDLNKKVFEDFK